MNLVETGYHRTPNLWWDHELGAGWPFAAFTYAAAVAEVQVDAFTGRCRSSASTSPTKAPFPGPIGP